MILDGKRKADLDTAVEFLTEQLPIGWDLMHAFHNADDDYGFDNHPGANYSIGIIQGMADMAEMHVDEFLGTNGYDWNQVKEES